MAESSRRSPSAAPLAVADEAHRRLARLADVLLEPLLALDAEWRVVFVNGAAEAFLGHTKDDLLGRACDEALPDIQTSGGFAEAQRAHDDGQPRRVELRLASLDRWVRLTCYPLEEWLVVQLRDLTPERTAAAERERLLLQEHHAREAAEESYRTVEEANRAKSEFLAVMSHELRTPLTAIQGYVQLLQLIANAVKFTDVGGQLSIHCVPSGATTRIEVRDTGVGIPPEMLESVFEPFVQVDKRLTRRHEGVGLGLAISRDLAREMGGDLTATSTLGDGSVFTVTVPRARPTGSWRREDRRATSDRRVGEDRRSGEERRAP